jgi:2'-5' RNA ligase
MAFAIELYFDKAAELQIKKAWTELAHASLPAWPLRIGARPHISILILDEATLERLDAVFRSLLSAKAFDLVFKSVDHFAGDDAIIFLKPDSSVELLELHDRAVAAAQSRHLAPRHAGSEWTPHCTCDYGVGAEQLPTALSILRECLPVVAHVDELGYVEVTPESVRHLASVRIT